MIQSNSREMWDLINVDDRERLTVDQLETGIATVTRSDDFFDCHPAVQTAFKFTKLVTNRGVTKSEKDQVKEGEKKLKTIVFDEFRTFLSILRQYYIYCQVTKRFSVGKNQSLIETSRKPKLTSM